MDPIKNYALVTGGTQGIGLELARLFARDGYNLILVARNEDNLQQVADELAAEGTDVRTFSRDLFRAEQAFEIYEQIRNEGLIVDILVNDAGQGVYGAFIETDIQRELSIVQLNISSLIVLTKLFLKEMVSRGSGKILNVASVAGKVPGPYQAVYHGTKAFVHSFTEAVRSEVKNTRVTLTSLLPGPTDTDFFNKADMLSSKVVQEGELADAEIVARDGYDALMAGKDMVISGFKNKMQVALSNVLPDSMVADNTGKQQEPISNTTN